MPLSFVETIGHERDAYLFTTKDGSRDVQCAIKHSALEYSLTNRSHVTNADRERAFDENRDRIMRIASAKYDVGLKRSSGPLILITFEEYSTRQYP
jgi:hypothetical protein